MQKSQVGDCIVGADIHPPSAGALGANKSSEQYAPDACTGQGLARAGQGCVRTLAQPAVAEWPQRTRAKGRQARGKTESPGALGPLSSGRLTLAFGRVCFWPTWGAVGCAPVCS